MKAGRNSSPPLSMLDLRFTAYGASPFRVDRKVGEADPTIGPAAAILAIVALATNLVAAGAPR